MDDSQPLKTLLDLAQHLGVTRAKSGRRALLKAMENDPGLRVTMRGRTVLFTDEQFARTVKALEWRSPSATAARSTSSVRRFRAQEAGRSASQDGHARFKKRTYT